MPCRTGFGEVDQETFCLKFGTRESIAVLEPPEITAETITTPIVVPPPNAWPA
jgi:hypothetical protein